MELAGNRKKSLWVMRDVFMWETDENHALTKNEIIRNMRSCGADICKDAFYDTKNMLIDMGVDVKEKRVGKYKKFYLGSRDFSISDIKVLIDCLVASEFVTQEVTDDLIKKLTKQVSRYQASELKRQIHTAEHFKSVNNKAMKNVDRIHKAINQNKQMTFKYWDWTEDYKRSYRHNGILYEVSPWALVYKNERYYLLGYSHKDNQFRHYRVDKMENCVVLDKIRLGLDGFRYVNPQEYANCHFGMFAGQNCRVEFLITKKMIDVFITKFGRGLSFRKVQDETYTVYVNVVLSQQFVGWVVGLGDTVSVMGPECAVNRMRLEGIRLRQAYI